MKQLYDETSHNISKVVTKKYSTSFSLAVRMLAPKIRPAIYSIYGFVRFADEIVDTFHEYNQKKLIKRFEKNYYLAYKKNISLNPILHSFQQTVKKYNITDDLIQAFLNSMKMDLKKSVYDTKDEYDQYIYGSADVVGLMCLKVFVDGDEEKYKSLKDSAMSLGSAFQKVNFLRDLKDDTELLDRSYFPQIDFDNLDQEKKNVIIEEIENDFQKAYEGIKKLPIEAKFGVYTAYMYYSTLLRKLKRTHYSKILNARIRVSNPMKFGLLAKSYLAFKLNLL